MVFLSSWDGSCCRDLYHPLQVSAARWEEVCCRIQEPIASFKYRAVWFSLWHARLLLVLTTTACLENLWRTPTGLQVSWQMFMSLLKPALTLLRLCGIRPGLYRSGQQASEISVVFKKGLLSSSGWSLEPMKGSSLKRRLLEERVSWQQLTLWLAPRPRNLLVLNPSARRIDDLLRRCGYELAVFNSFLFSQR